VGPKTKIQFGEKKDEESSSKEKESNKEEVSDLKKLGAKTEIKRGPQQCGPYFLGQIQLESRGRGWAPWKSIFHQMLFSRC